MLVHPVSTLEDDVDTPICHVVATDVSFLISIQDT